MEKNNNYQQQLVNLLQQAGIPQVHIPCTDNSYYIIPANGLPDNTQKSGQVQACNDLQDLESLFARFATDIEARFLTIAKSLIAELKTKNESVSDDNEANQVNEIPQNIEASQVTEAYLEHVPNQHVATSLQIHDYESRIEALYCELDQKKDSLRNICDSLIYFYLNLYQNTVRMNELPPFYSDLKRTLAQLLDKAGIYLLEEDLDESDFDDRYMNIFKEQPTTELDLDGKIKLHEPGFYFSDGKVFDPDDMYGIEIIKQPKVILYKYTSI